VLRAKSIYEFVCCIELLAADTVEASVFTLIDVTARRTRFPDLIDGGRVTGSLLVRMKSPKDKPSASLSRRNRSAFPRRAVR
jgi:hypothetical protein